MERFVKTFYSVRSMIDERVNEFATENSLSTICVSIEGDGAGGIYATVVFEKKPKATKKKGASNDKD